MEQSIQGIGKMLFQNKTEEGENPTKSLAHTVAETLIKINDKFCTLKKLSEECGISEAALLKGIERSNVPAYKWNGRWMVSKYEFNECIKRVGTRSLEVGCE